MANATQGAAVLDAKAVHMPKVLGPKLLADRVNRLWSDGLPPGDKTGWASLDKFYTIAEGQLTIVTGWPGAGKSEWLDALLVNLAIQGWKFGIFSPENQPVEVHISKLLEKISGKPFGQSSKSRMTQDEVTAFTNELDQSFGFMEATGRLSSPEDVLEAVVHFLFSFGADAKRGLVIDPWNELEHWRPAQLSETEYVSKTLSMVRNWARKNKVHVWIVAHPQKMRRENGVLPIPRPDMIAGSQHWWNKADCAITVYRDFDKINSPDVDIHVQKVRFKHVGRPGLVTLQYDRITGRYHEKTDMKVRKNET